MNTQIKSMAIIASVVLSTVAFSAPAFSAGFGTAGYADSLHKMAMMRMIDANGDHMVSSDEFNTYYGAIFDELDTDHEGSLDEKEWVGVKGDQKISLATGGYSRQLRTLKMMDAMDTNGDHLVTKDEFVKFHQSLFQSMDKSGDHQLNPQEWLARQTGNK